MDKIADPSTLRPGTELLYLGSDFQWHYAKVARVDADAAIVDTPQGMRKASFGSLSNPEYWRYR